MQAHTELEHERKRAAAELAALKSIVTTERQGARTVERYAALPWWRRRVRREIQEQLAWLDQVAGDGKA